jgi:hypothetical protein
MRSAPTHSLRPPAALLLGLMLVAAPARSQEWYELYEQGLDAITAQQWEGAITQLGRAIGLRAEPGANVKTYGLQFIDYFPYTYRGMANYRAGHYAQALEDLQRADRIGAARDGRSDVNAAKILKDYLALARQHQVDSEAFATAVAAYREEDYRTALDGFNAIGTTSSFYAEAQRYISMTNESLKARRAQPPQVVQQDAAVEGQPKKPADRAATPPASPPGDQEFKDGVKLFAARDWGGAEAKFQAALAKDRTHQGAAEYLRRIRAERTREQQLAQRRASAPPATRTLPAREAEPETAAVDRHQEVEDSLLAIAVALYENGLLERSEETFGRIKKTNPAQQDAAFYLEKISANRQSIREGIVAYFEGEYEAAISRLSDAAKVNKESASLYGYLAAACAARYYLTGAEDEALRKRAFTAFRTARQLDGTYSPDRRYTSPRIISMLNSPQDTP